MSNLENSTLDSLVMVDLLGRIVYINNTEHLSNFVNGEMGKIIGEPFSQVFNIDFDKFRQITNHLDQSDSHGHGTIQLPTHDSILVDIIYEGSTQLDQNDNPMGYDLLLRIPVKSKVTALDNSIADESIILQIYTQQALKGLAETFHHMGGKYLSGHFERAINTTIRVNGWSAEFREEQLTVDDLPRSALEAILTRGILFSTHVLGRKLVNKVFDKLDSDLSDDDKAIVSTLNLSPYLAG